MRTCGQIHRFIIRLHPLQHTHGQKRRIRGSARILRAPFGILPNGFLRQDAANNRRAACAPQKIVVHRFLHFPHRTTPVLSKAIERAHFSQSAPGFLR